MSVEEFVIKASRAEIFELFTKTSRLLIIQERIKNKSEKRELETNFKNKKQHDSFYAKSFNDHRIYNSYLDDLKILIKHI